METNKIEPSPTGTYKRDENDLTDVVYATHENPYDMLNILLYFAIRTNFSNSMVNCH